ncbi:hypothetical protein [Persephonella sp.]
MERISQKTYLEEIKKLIKEKTGTNRFLSSKEESLIKELYLQNIPLDRLKKTIESEIVSYPSHRRKKFSLLKIKQKLFQIKPYKDKFKEKDHKITDKWIDILHRLKIPPEAVDLENIDPEFMDIEIERKIINFLWKNLPEEDKKRIQEEAKKEVQKKFILKNINVKKVIKSLIYKKLKKIHNIP